MSGWDRHNVGRTFYHQKRGEKSQTQMKFNRAKSLIQWPLTYASALFSWSFTWSKIQTIHLCSLKSPRSTLSRFYSHLHSSSIPMGLCMYILLPRILAQRSPLAPLFFISSPKMCYVVLLHIVTPLLCCILGEAAFQCWLMLFLSILSLSCTRHSEPQLVFVKHFEMLEGVVEQESGIRMYFFKMQP